MENIELIKKSIETEGAVLIVGTGFSAATAAGNPHATWIGLIRHGIETIKKLNSSENEKWAARSIETLDDNPKISDLLQLTTGIKSKFDELGEGNYRAWLKETIGELTAQNKELGLAIKDLQIPIFTTNYDTLLEETTGYASANRDEVDKLHENFLSDKKYIGHLHGIYDAPDSIVFTQGDYDNVVSDSEFRFIEDLLYNSKIFIYVGYGAGLEDPNFSKLIQQNNDRFKKSMPKHFILCREEDLEKVSIDHYADNIVPVSYGKDYSDLVPFIKSLKSEKGNSSLLSPSFAISRILDELKESSTIHSISGGINNLLDEILIPPILLTTSHEEFAVTNSSNVQTPEKIDINSIDFEGKNYLIIGDNISGLTTSLKYLILQVAKSNHTIFPIYIDARNINNRFNLEKLVRNRCLDLRVVESQDSKIPNIVLAIDNVSPKNKFFIEKIVSSLEKINPYCVFIGCRPAEESTVLQELNDNNLKIHRNMYIGKFSVPEIRNLSRIINPEVNADTIAHSVLEIATREHLPRTPFNISLLISLVIDARKKQQSYKSETALLEEYVNLVLEKFGTDSYLDYDSQNRQKALSDIAMYFISEQKASAPRSEVLKVVEETNDKYGWGGNASELFDSFLQSYILQQTDNGEIKFQQSVYFHLFAAKAAIKDNEFKTKLLSNVLTYSMVLRHYAALVRDSVELLEKTNILLDEYFDNQIKGRIFSQVTKRELPSGEIQTEVFDSIDSTRSDLNEAKSDASPDEHTDEYYDVSDDSDIEPYPFSDISNLPKLLIQNHLVEFASKVLRDSDEVSLNDESNIKLKSLLKILNSWGYLIDSFETDSNIITLVEEIISHLEEDTEETSESDKDSLKIKMLQLLPFIVVLFGMARTLKSKKLEEVQKQLCEKLSAGDSALESDDISPVMIFLFSYLLDSNNWGELLNDLSKSHGDLWVVNNMIYSLIIADYTHNTISNRRIEGQALNFIKTNTEKIYSINNKREIDIWNQRLEKSLLQKKNNSNFQGLHPLRAIKTIVD